MLRHKDCPGPREPSVWGMEVACVEAPCCEWLAAPLVHTRETQVLGWLMMEGWGLIMPQVLCFSMSVLWPPAWLWKQDVAGSLILSDDFFFGGISSVYAVLFISDDLSCRVEVEAQNFHVTSAPRPTSILEADITYSRHFQEQEHAPLLLCPIPG